MKLAKGNVKIDIYIRFGPDWPGIRCLAKTRRSTACQRLHTSTMAAAHFIEPKTQRGLQRISEANIKHGRQTKEKLAAQRHAAKIGRRVRGELKRIERRIVDAGLMPEPSDDFKAASSARVRSKQPVEAVSGRPVMGQYRLAQLGLEGQEAQNNSQSRRSFGCLTK